jgi:hypothetical protein
VEHRGRKYRLAGNKQPQPVEDQFWSLLLDSFRQSLLVFLERSPKLLPSTSNAAASLQLLNVSSSIVRLLNCLLESAPDKILETAFTKSADIIVFLGKYLLRCFSASCVSYEDLENRLYCLRSLLAALNVQGFARRVPPQAITDLIAVLTQTIGCLQQSFASSDQFSHQDRGTYRLVALCLRNLSRVVLNCGEDKQSGQWVWGDHWFFENSLEWLLTLLSDDDMRLEKIGLGIISNLILIPASYQSIMQKIPNFLDMALVKSLDADRHEMIRQESWLVINNFFIRFCHDNDITAQSASGRQTNATEAVQQLLKVFDNCLFFDRLAEVIGNGRRFVLGGPLAFATLLKNICLVSPAYLRSKLLETEFWTHFESLVFPLDRLDALIVAEDFDGHHGTAVVSKGGQSGPLECRFRNQQFHILHDKSMTEAQTKLVCCLRLLSMDHPSTTGDDFTIDEVNDGSADGVEATINHVLSCTKIIPSCWRTLGWYLNHLPHNSESQQQTTELCVELCGLLAEYLPQFYIHRRSPTMQWAELMDQQSVYQLTQFTAELIHHQTSGWQSAAYCLSKLFCLAGLDNGLAEPVELALAAGSGQRLMQAVLSSITSGERSSNKASNRRQDTEFILITGLLRWMPAGQMNKSIDGKLSYTRKKTIFIN